ncbi:ImmA/IrrE family metallo-endopeptidase [Clostridium sp. DJ247]|uniref:ImmA/IrrE family metallo-endopeptidase n=1 Tax=Clostridium sp. DJ247 TaxID=2726188 RepID=UPI001625C0A3|nr:ImmA/IrrE family metallo-endopeptidase [Clostridium sp. DJ247]MBC2582689.1 ImmA/IrrE family metallo-endopeptidase [Clostridium sp. DJ247]
MNCYYPKSILQQKEIKIIKEKVKSISKEKNIVNPIIKDDIFRILETVSKVLYYPIKDDIRAFYMKINKSKFNDNIIFINTSMTYEKQVFAAAYEFAHIMLISKNHKEDLNGQILLNYSDNKALDINTIEAISNRFAAEFLVRDDILEIELKNMGMEQLDSITLEGIVKLMDLFLFPYKAMIKRLYEIGKLSRKKYEELTLIKSSGNDSSVIEFEKRLGLCSRNNEITKVKKFSNFIDLAINSYDNTISTYDKLEYLLKLFDLKPSSFNIKKKYPQYLTREELEMRKLLYEE